MNFIKLRYSKATPKAESAVVGVRASTYSQTQRDSAMNHRQISLTNVSTSNNRVVSAAASRRQNFGDDSQSSMEADAYLARGNTVYTNDNASIVSSKISLFKKAVSLKKEWS